MNIYRLEQSLFVSGGTGQVATLKVNGGLLRQFQIRAESTNTVFKAVFLDKNSAEVLNYGFHTQEINDTGASGALPVPLLGTYTIRVTSATLATACSINLLVQE